MSKFRPTPEDGLSGKKIQTLEEFKSIISEGEGFIALTDDAVPNRIHSVTCYRLKPDWFFEKVVENKGKNGLYLWYPSKEEAQNANPNTENCKFCNA